MVGGAFVELVEELKRAMSIQDICRHMGIARSTYYRWEKNRNKTAKKTNEIKQLANSVQLIISAMATERSPLYFQEPVKRPFS